MTSHLTRYHEAGKSFEEYLRLASYPIAIKLIKEEDDVPEDTKQPSKDLKLQTFLCQNFKIVRSYGWTLLITKDDCCCKIARTLYRWEKITDTMIKWALKFNIGLYSKDESTSKKIEKHLSFLKEDYYGLVISPLSRTKVKPDIVQIYCMPAQAMRITHAYLYMRGGSLAFEDMGRIGSCHLGVIKPFQTNEPQFVILGNGDRVWGGAEDHEVLYALPESKLDLILQGLKETHNAGLRYPIPKYMNYTPGFQADFAQKAKKRAGGTLVKEQEKSD